MVIQGVKKKLGVNFNKPLIIISFLILIVASLYLLQFHERGIPDDENYDMNIVKRILDGEIPYRDFYLHQPPGSYYIQSVIFKLFRKELIISRLVTLFLSLFIFVILFFISRQIIPTNFKFIASFIFLLWGTPHHNFFSPATFGLAFSLLQLFVFLKYVENNHKLYLFLSGFLACATFLMKQNLGSAVFLYTIFVFLILVFINSKSQPLILRIKIFISDLVIFVCGFVLGLVPLLIYFIFRGTSFNIVCQFIKLQQKYTKQTGLNNLFFWFMPSYEFRLNLSYGLVAIFLIVILYFLFKRCCLFIIKQKNIIKYILIILIGVFIGLIFVLENSRNTVLSFLTNNTERVYIYIPYILVLISLVWLIRKRLKVGQFSIYDKKVIVVTLFVLFYTYFNFLYSANFIRAILASPPAFLLLGFYLYKFVDYRVNIKEQKIIKIYFITLFLLIFMFMGFWISYMQYAEKIFMFPITEFNTPLKIRGAKRILVTPKAERTITSVVRYIKTHTDKDEYIFVFPYDLLFYFLTDRKSPTFYEWFVGGDVPLEYQQKTIEDIERKNVRYVILRDYNSDRFANRKYYTIIDKYLQDKFYTQAAFDNFMILRKNTDNSESPFVSKYKKICSGFQRNNLLFVDNHDNNKMKWIANWKSSGLGLKIDKTYNEFGSETLHLLPNSFGQYLHQNVKLQYVAGGRITFGIWAKGPKSPAFIRLGISTSIGFFPETYNTSSTWMFYIVKGRIGKGDTSVDLYIYPDDGFNGGSISRILVSGPLLVYGDIPSMEDMQNVYNK